MSKSVKSCNMTVVKRSLLQEKLDIKKSCVKLHKRAQAVFLCVHALRMQPRMNVLYKKEQPKRRPQTQNQKIRLHADLSEGHGGDPWDGARGDIRGLGARDVRGLGARDVLGVQGACLEVGRAEVGHVEVVRDVLLHSAAQLPAAPSADELSSQRTSTAPCGTPVALSKAAASGAPAIKGKTPVKSTQLDGQGGKFKLISKALLTAHNFDLFFKSNH